MRHVYTRTFSVPNAPQENWVPIRTVRVPDQLWDEVKRIAADRDETVTDVILRALERYVILHPLDDD